MTRQRKPCLPTAKELRPIGGPGKTKSAPPGTENEAEAESASAPPWDEPKGKADASETRAIAANPAAESKAASLLNQARAFEKSGKPAVAVIHYRLIVREHPDVPEAKTAAERIKTLNAK